MAKKIKTPNQFGATDGTATATETKAPGDETPKVTTPTVRVKKNGEPWKQRAPMGPRVVNPKVAEFKAAAKKALDEFMAEQKAGLEALQKSIELETKTAKAATKMAATLLKLNPEEQAWLLKANAEKLANLDKIKAQMTAP